MARKTGFDKPLKVKVQITPRDIASLRMLLAHRAPLGKARSKSFNVKHGKGRKTYTYTNAPPAPGKLRQSFLKAGSVKLTRKGTGVIITSDLPYARIQDQGGTIKAHTQPAGAPNMMFRAGRKVVFTRHRGPIKIKAQNYVNKAVEDWVTKRGFAQRIRVQWAAFKGGAE